MDYTKEYKAIAEQFCLLGEVKEIVPYGEGHINVTYLVTTTEKRYIMQRMNTNVFPDTVGLMANICGVTEHLRARGIETLCVIPTKAGESYLVNELGSFRVYDFIENRLNSRVDVISTLYPAASSGSVAIL